MKNYLIGIIHSENGIQRDGTAYAARAYIDGLWVRFYEGYPKKIGGCKLTYVGTDYIVRSMLVVPNSAEGIFLYMGTNPPLPPSGLPILGAVSYTSITLGGDASPPQDRTPASWGDPLGPYPDITNVVWNFDSGNFLDEAEVPHTLIFANPIKNDLSSVTEYPVYAGDITTNTPLLPLYYVGGSQQVTASGGILVCPPVLVAYGTNGILRWSSTTGQLNPDDATSVWPLTNQLRVARTKLVKAVNILGGTYPTILLWSINSLYRATLVPNPLDGPEPSTFISTTIHYNISIISPNSVVIYDQLVFWIGADQFYVYNGIVQSLPNTMNNDWFFNRVNTQYKSKIFGVTVPRYKEIWWFYPRDESTECNAVIIYNVETQKWDDNTIPVNAPFGVYPFTRSAGVSATGSYPFPIYADNTLVAPPSNPLNPTYPIWTHEIGVDRQVQDQIFAINSFFTTHLVDLWTQDGANSNLLVNKRIVPDFLQNGEMSVTINHLFYPNSPVITDGPYNFLPSTEVIDFSSQGGLCSFTFQSNVVGGDYMAGKALYFYEKGDTLK